MRLQRRTDALIAELQKILSPQQVAGDLLTRLAYARDASAYRIVPLGVVFPKSIAEIQALFRFAHRWQVPLTFRAAGTSLSGQAVGSGVIVDVRRYWTRLSIEDEGATVRFQPGVRAGEVNQRLRRYGRKIGPDPASINFCLMGGILANNASGMCCGVRHNAYHTLRAMTFVLPNGTVIDTADPEAESQLQQQATALYEGIVDLRQRLQERPDWQQVIRSRYRQKNTTGYSLNALLDFQRPVDIVAHLLIGSEGSLGFIAEASLETIPIKPFPLTALAIFESIEAAAAVIPQLQDAEALELMDAACLQQMTAALHQFGLETVPDRRSAALLVEFGWTTAAERDQKSAAIAQRLRSLPGLWRLMVSENEYQRAQLWNLRKGLYPAVGGQRPPGTTLIIEDVVFPIDRLAAAVAALQQLFADHGYDNAIIFGHAKDGNLHFVITPDLQQPDAVRRYDRFMQDLVRLVVDRFGGALKGEHGTGRNIAPFVASEWGEELTQLMWEIKTLFDPAGILNPDVVLSTNVRVHCENLKRFPTVSPEVDQCTECGFCESICPSRSLTLTPRQRIQLAREWQYLSQTGQQRLRRVHRYAVDQTCATDHLCSVLCPLDIDIGAFVLQQRQQRQSGWKQRLAVHIAKHFAAAETVIRWGIKAAKGIAKTPVAALLPAAARQWLSVIQPVRRQQLQTSFSEGDLDTVILPSCPSRLVSGTPAPLPVQVARIMALQQRAVGIWTQTPFCCGLVFDSRGLPDAARWIREFSLQQLERHFPYQNGAFRSDEGKAVEMLIDHSACAAHWQKRMPKYPIQDAQWYLLQHGTPSGTLEHVAVHLACGIVQSPHFPEIYQQLQRYVPAAIITQCCGMAGDRGIRFPELPRAAIQQLELPKTIRWLYTTSASCALALQQHCSVPVKVWTEWFEPCGKR